MEIASIPSLMMFAVVFVTACNRLGLYYRRKFPEDLSFSLSCFAFSAYAAASAGLYSSGSPIEGSLWQRIQLVTLGFFAPALAWFFYNYTGRTVSRFIMLISVPSIMLGLMNGLWAGPYTVSRDITSVKTVSLPFERILVYNEMAIGPLVFAQFIVIVVLLVHGVMIIFRAHVEGISDRYRYLLLSFIAFVITGLMDLAVGAGWLSMPYMMEVGFFAMIVFILAQNSMQLTRLGDVELLERQHETRRARYFNLSSEGICLIRFRRPICIDDPVPIQVRDLLRYAYISECNRALTEMMGLHSMTGILNKIITRWIRHDASLQQSTTELFVRSGYRLVEYETCEKDVLGHTRYFINNIYGHVDGRQLVEVWAAKREISDIRRMLEALRRSEERYRNYVRNSTEGIWRFDFTPPIPTNLIHAQLIDSMIATGRLGEANDTMLMMYQSEAPQGLLGLRLVDVLSDDQQGDSGGPGNGARGGRELVMVRQDSPHHVLSLFFRFPTRDFSCSIHDHQAAFLIAA